MYVCLVGPVLDMNRIALLLSISALACNGTIEDPTEPLPNLCDAARDLRTTPAFMTVAKEADIAARVLSGGFGGLYQDLQAGVLVAYFKDTAPAAQRRADLQKVLQCSAVYPGWAETIVRTALEAIDIRQGQYSGTELLAFLTGLQPLESDPGVWGLEVDPETNRVWIGLTDASERTRIQQAIVALSVPLAAVAIESPPPIAGSEQFEVLNVPAPALFDTGAFIFWLRVRFTNLQSAPRYPDWCVSLDASVPPYFMYTMEKWDGTAWVFVKSTTCVAVLLPPRQVLPGQTVTDSIPVLTARKLNTNPAFLTARITGNYRLVARVYRSTTGTPPGPVFVTDPAPHEEQVSRPFRIKNTLPL